MPLLATDAYRFALSKAMSEASESISLASAYVTLPGIEWVLNHLPATPIELRVMARWRCADLVSGASDVEVFPRLRSRGARFYVHQDLHAKLAIVDGRFLFIGSANLTSAGLQLVPGGNRELGIALPVSPGDLGIIQNLYDEAVELDSKLYAEMLAYINRIEARSGGVESADWPVSVAKRLARSPARLWVAELPWSSSPSDLVEQGEKGVSDDREGARHDLALLGLNRNGPPSLVAIGERFRECRAWRWLEATLSARSEREIYFGELSALLHTLLLDDPRPYRKDVKGLLTNLLNWAALLSDGRLVLDRPAHSQRIRLLS